MSSSNEVNFPFNAFNTPDEKRSNLDFFQNTVKSLSLLNPSFLNERKSMNFNIFHENPDFSGEDDNHSYNPFPIPNCSNYLYNEPHNDSFYMAKENDYNISDINPSQNDRDYFAQKIDIEKEIAITLEGKFFLNFILIPLETDGITFTFAYEEEEKKKKFQIENTTLNQKSKRSHKKKKKNIYYKNFNREDLNRIIQENNLLPSELKKEIYKPNINKIITILKDSPYSFENIRNLTFKDIFTF